MKIAYCSVLLPAEKDFPSKTKYKIPGIALHKFSSAVIQGLEENLKEEDNITVFGITNVINYPKFPQLFFKKEFWSHNGCNKDIYIGYINLFGIKYKTQSSNLYKELEQWIKTLGDEQGIICVYNIFYPVMNAAIKIKKKYGDKVHLCLITGDMVAKYNLKSQKNESIKQKMINHLENKIYKMVKQFDSFVFATKDMATAYEVDQKPYTVLECTYLNEKENSDISYNSPNNDKIIFYAGAVRYEYGIHHLLEALVLEDHLPWINRNHVKHLYIFQDRKYNKEPVSLS